MRFRFSENGIDFPTATAPKPTSLSGFDFLDSLPSKAPPQKR